ncbi:DUF4164 domain-containing protein [Dolichospermum sp. LEGE 00240]|uniref:DUF4164 domain-containing protein n=1 Tax=Dolichospermum sp. LEGE 00240 TaxID=1828603 RepID=UPI00187F6D12|nr:DUF4164 domain-containing protein [Dolichospermum sp. LEGE 00240]MBE9247658.1 DUF4164 domain-containing protein [Dolichospermum sp. LEGE 00240]
MTTNPPILTYTLEEILSRLDQKIEKQFTEVNQKMDRQFTEVNQKMEKQFSEVNKKLETIDNKLNKLEIGQAELSGEIKTLEEKVIGIDKRLDNQEFINRGVLVAVIIALISGVVKLFSFFPAGKI